MMRGREGRRDKAGKRGSGRYRRAWEEERWERNLSSINIQW